MSSDKYWISPSGGIAEVDDRHIITIMLEPKSFGLTKAYIDKVHKKHGEQLGTEGNAREEILTKLMDKGWIRLRYISREDVWFIQLSEKSEIPYKGRIKKWARVYIENAGNKWAEVTIMNLVPVAIESRYSVMEVASGALEERKKKGTFADFLNPKKKAYKKAGTVKRRYIIERKKS